MSLALLKNALLHNDILPGVAGGNDISIELYAPWRVSQTGRVAYYVYIGDSQAPSFVVKDTNSFFWLHPMYSSPSFKSSFMPKHGMFILQGRSFEWSEFVNGCSLRGILSEQAGEADALLLHTFMVNYLAEQKESAIVGPVPFTLMRENCLTRMYEQKARRVFTQLCEVFPGDDDVPSFPCSWSHGDLWGEDILVRDDSFTVLDWEWSLPLAPLGADLVDLLIGRAVMDCGLSFSEAWKDAFKGQSLSFGALRAALPFKADEWKILVGYCALRSLGRELAQDGMAPDVVRAYAAQVYQLREI